MKPWYLNFEQKINLFLKKFAEVYSFMVHIYIEIIANMYDIKQTYIQNTHTHTHIYIYIYICVCVCV